MLGNITSVQERGFPLSDPVKELSLIKRENSNRNKSEAAVHENYESIFTLLIITILEQTLSLCLGF